MIDVATTLPVVLRYGLYGSLAFTGLILLQYALGSANSVRDEQGRFREETTPLARAVFVLAFAAMVAAPLLANLALARSGAAPGFLAAAVVAYAVFLFLNLWDLLVLDLMLVLAVGRRWLDLPDTPYYTTVRPHVEGFARGLVIGVVPSLLAAGMTMLII